MNELNNSSPVFNCEDCKITIPNENQYNIHRALSHDERCKYECVCGKDYMFRKDLKRHQRKCTAQESYRCGKCEFIFSDVHNGRMHEAVCQPTVNIQNRMVEPTRNELLALSPKEDYITPYETAFDGRLASYFIRSLCCMDLSQFLKSVKTKVYGIIEKHVNRVFSINVNLWVDCTFENMQGEKMTKALKTSNTPVYKGTDIDEYLSNAFLKLKREMEEAAMSKSGWKLISVDGLRVRIGKYNPLKISSFIPLPKNIQNKKACINVRNYDNKCFMYAILAKFVKKNAHLPNRYRKRSLRNKYNFACVQYPTDLKSIPIFEKENNITINIFGLDERNHVYPLRIVEKKCCDHRNLLLLGDKNHYHYVYIKSFKKLIFKQIGANKRSKLICDRCFTQFDKRYNGKIRFKRHKQICGTKTPAVIELPFKKPVVMFECVERMHRVPIVIYLDFETILEKVATCQPSIDQSYTSITHRHTPMSFCLYVKTSNELNNIEHGLPKDPYLYRGVDAAKHCIMKLKEIAETVAVLYSLNMECSLNDEEMVYHSEASECYLCNQAFLNAKRYRKVIDHSHLSGEYRGPAHNNCNLRCRAPIFLPVFCHNLSGYDAHIIVKELGYDEKDIEVIPNTEEKYISFSKIINNKIKLRFLDTFRFMASSLDSLSKNLTHLPETSKFIPQNLMHLVKRKAVFPYEYVSNWEKLNETSYPSIEASLPHTHSYLQRSS